MSDWFLGVPDARLFSAAAVALAYFALCYRYLGRRSQVEVAAAPIATAPTLVTFASQTGFAERLAQQTVESLRSAGMQVELHSIAHLTPALMSQFERVLFVVSTTGEGDAPDPAAKFVRDVSRATPGAFQSLSYAVLALGDREYTNFCAFGHRLDGWLRQLGAQPLFDVVEVDNGDEGALRHWQHFLSLLCGSPDLPDWEKPQYEAWELASRRLVNPGSEGNPCYHIALRPMNRELPVWHAGDIAEVGPRASIDDATVLPHREYSIASIPADGEIHLLVRQMRRPSGELGIGSGWLTHHAIEGTAIALRIRTNSNFHLPGDTRPILFIGNGTGIAGLRALIKARAAAGQQRNWLIFGERHATLDYFYRDDLERWRTEGVLEELDLVFSRDQAERRYVQHRLLERADLLRRWIADGASVYVCGSLEGMAPAVDAALRTVLGDQAIEQLIAAGRYRRDVY